MLGGQNLCPVIRANYYKMGARNFLFTKQKDGFDALAIINEYA